MEDADDAAQQWDQRYRESERLWSGKVNDAVAAFAQRLTPGTALDIGCGEGADVIWLAQHGWRATGIDISQVAIQRATEAARAQGVPEGQAEFIAADLTDWQAPQQFDLVVAAFLHSHGEIDRGAALQTAQNVVAPNGHLLVVSHATFPPWAQARHDENAEHEMHGHDMTTPESELQLLQLDADEWSVEAAEIQSRQATGPDGQHAVLDDTVVLAKRIQPV